MALNGVFRFYVYFRMVRRDQSVWTMQVCNEGELYYFKTLNNRPWGANNESLGGPGGPGTGFCSPGGGFSGSRRSGKPLRLLRQKKPPPGLQKPVPGPPGPPRDSLLAPQGRLLSVLK